LIDFKNEPSYDLQSFAAFFSENKITKENLIKSNQTHMSSNRNMTT